MNKREAGNGLWLWLVAFGFILLGGAPALGGANSPFVIAGTTQGEMAANAAFDGTHFLVGIQGNERAFMKFPLAYVICCSA